MAPVAGSVFPSEGLQARTLARLERGKKRHTDRRTIHSKQAKQVNLFVVKQICECAAVRAHKIMQDD